MTEGKVRTMMTYDTVDLFALIKMVKNGNEVGYHTTNSTFLFHTHTL
jgi:hypothetical protein